MRTFIGIIAFLVWGAISIPWYVCGVKGLCADEKKEVLNTVPTKAEPVVDTIVEEVEPQSVALTITNMVINFPYAESEVKLSKNQTDSLKVIVGELQLSDAVLVLHGNTDDVGSEENNLQLGKERAEWVKGLMISYGLGEGKMVVESNGESKPVAENKTKVGRAKNRRVDIFVKTK